MVSRTVSEAVFACHSRACIPPTSGGTGGSSPSGKSGKQGDGTWKVGDYSIARGKKGYVITRPDGGTNTASTLKRAKATIAKDQAAKSAPKSAPKPATTERPPTFGSKTKVTWEQVQGMYKILNDTAASGKAVPKWFMDDLERMTKQYQEENPPG